MDMLNSGYPGVVNIMHVCLQMSLRNVSKNVPKPLAPTVWNILPAKIQALTKFDEFKTKIGE